MHFASLEKKKKKTKADVIRLIMRERERVLIEISSWNFRTFHWMRHSYFESLCMFNMLARLLKLVSKQQNELYIQRVMPEWLKLYQLPKAFILTTKLFLPIKENCVPKPKVPKLYFFRFDDVRIVSSLDFFIDLSWLVLSESTLFWTFDRFLHLFSPGGLFSDSFSKNYSRARA